MGLLTDILQANGVRLEEAFPSLGADPDLYVRDPQNPFDAYRRLTQQTRRQLAPIDQDRMIEIAAWMYDTNPLAHRLIELLNDFIVGDGFTYTCAHPDVQAVIDEFWTDWVNRWDTKQWKRFRQLSLFGDQAYPLFVRPRDGRVRLGYIDPINVKAVSTDPQNAEMLAALQLKDRAGQPGPIYRIIHLDEMPGSRTEGLLVGEPATGDGPAGTFFFAINNFTNSPRGKSDLISCFDWLDLYDQFLFGQAETAAHRGDVVWDVELAGMTPEQIRQWLREQPPMQGSMLRAHNEKVKWNAVAPNFHAADVSEQARTIRGQIVTPHGFPEHWLYSGSETNLATATAQTLPILKYLNKRQYEAVGIVKFILETVRDQAMIAGRLPRTLTPEQRAIKVNAAETSYKDLKDVATTLEVTSRALVVAQMQAQPWVSAEEAAQIFRKVAAEYGVELSQDLPKPEIDQLQTQIRQATELTETIRALWSRLEPQEQAVLAAIGDNGGHGHG